MQIKKIIGGSVATCSATPKDISTDWFQRSFWENKQAITGSSRGRYITWFVEQGDEEWVLRHYYRGGLVGKLCKDSYFFTGYQHTRAFAELKLLEQLHQEGFAVPEPVAALVQRHGLYYSADIIIKRIENAQDLVAQLSQTQMTQSQWQNLGACIAQFHQRGVYHADLNAKNILLSDNKFYLIDFDRGVLRKPEPKWQQANLARLLRSFHKEKSKCSALHFEQQNWQQLLIGYQGGSSV